MIAFFRKSSLWELERINHQAPTAAEEHQLEQLLLARHGQQVCVTPPELAPFLRQIARDRVWCQIVLASRSGAPNVEGILTAVLRRNRPPHARLFRRTGLSDPLPMQRIEPGKPLDLLRRPLALHPAGEFMCIRLRRQTVRPPQLARLLKTVAFDAGLNVISRDTPGASMGAFIRQIERYQLSAGVAAKGLVRQFRGNEGMDELLARAERQRWMGQSAPHGIAILLATLVTATDVCVDGVWVRTPNITCTGLANGTAGPFLVIAVLGRSADGNAEIRRAYAHPVLDNDRLVLVESNNERRVLRFLEEIVGRLQMNVSVHKPIFPVAGTRLTPDFVLSAANRPPLYIEVLGFAWADYLLTKEVHAEVLRRTGAYVSFKAFRSSWGGEFRRLKSSVREWASGVVPSELLTRKTA